jgi:hypothetical protein
MAYKEEENEKDEKKYEEEEEPGLVLIAEVDWWCGRSKHGKLIQPGRLIVD